MSLSPAHPSLQGAAILLRGVVLAAIGGTGERAGAWGTETVSTVQTTLPAPRTLAEVKSFYLINFARFVEWPSAAFPTADVPLLIGLLGRDSLGAALQAYEGQTIKGHRIKILRSRDLRELMACQVLYISDSEEDDLTYLFRALKGRPVLTFGETQGFLELGGMVRFSEKQNQTKIQVNRKGAEAVQLKVSSRLLAITTIVE